MRTNLDFSDWRSRCHSLGKLMTEPKAKSNKQKLIEAESKYSELTGKIESTVNKETKTYANLIESRIKVRAEIEKLEPIQDVPNLSQTCITKLSEIYTVETTGRTKDIKSKYMEKGLLMEEDAITAYCELTKQFLKKNKVEKENEYLTGTIDILENDFILDTKCCWDIFTFDAKAFKPLDQDYYWQLQGYMFLWNKPSSKLIYSLQNTPVHLVEKERKRLLFDFCGSDEDWTDAENELKFLHNYDDLALERKNKIYEIKRDDEAIDRIKARIIDCRYYLNNINNIKYEPDTND